MRIPASRTPWVLMAALFVASMIPADGATVRRYQLDEVRDQAVSVFWGQVVDKNTRIGTEGKMVWTDYEVSVSEHMRGNDPGVRTTVSFAGGTRGDLSVGIPGVPRLDVGENYVFFVQEGPLRPTATIGWGQGLFRVARVNLGGTIRDLLVSYDGEPLQLTAEGQITRGPAVRIENGGVWDASLRLEPNAIRMPDPVFTTASGATIEQPVAPSAETTPLLERRFATLDDLRAFVRGSIDSQRGGQR